MPTKTAVTCQNMDRGSVRVSSGTWHQDNAVSPLILWGGGVAPVLSMVALHPTKAQLDWNVGNFRAKSKPWAFCYVPSDVLEWYLWSDRALYSSRRGCTSSAILFRWVVQYVSFPGK